MPAPTIDQNFTVGNASKNAPAHVLYVKSLLFAAPEGAPTVLTVAEKSAISQMSETCEPAMVQALARIQNAHVPSEKGSGGRVVAWSKTLALLQKHAKVGVAYDAAEGAAAAAKELVLALVKSESVVDVARAESLGAAAVSYKGTSGKTISGTANVLKETKPAVLDVDLSKWIREVRALKTPYKVTGGVGAQAGVEKFGGGGGTVEITNSDTLESKTYAMYFGSLGASVAKVSFSVSTPLHESGSVTHIYRGPLRRKPVNFDTLGGSFVALSGGIAGHNGVMSGAVTIYFFGFSILDFQGGINPSWEMLQKCAGITMVWGMSSGFTDTYLDGGVQFQTGKMLGRWQDIVAN